MPTKEIHLGLEEENQKRHLYYWFAIGANEKEFEEWLEEHRRDSQEDVKKLFRLLIVMFGHNRPLLSNSIKQFRKETTCHQTVVWAIKSGQFRLYGILSGLDFIIFHFTRKKRDKFSSRDKKTICDRINRYNQENNN